MNRCNKPGRWSDDNVLSSETPWGIIPFTTSQVCKSCQMNPYKHRTHQTNSVHIELV